MKRAKNVIDIELCKMEIRRVLTEYNCELMSADEWSNVLLRDRDTDETVGSLNPCKRR